MLDGSNEHCAVESVGQLAHALCKEKLNESQLVRVFWPRNRCVLLRDDVVFVDSPGVDVSPNLDEWIDLHCLDADVFVLVCNAESTIMHTVSCGDGSGTVSDIGFAGKEILSQGVQKTVEPECFHTEQPVGRFG